MTPVSLEHIRQLQVLLLRMREYIQQGQSQKAEQLGYDHMALTGKGHIYHEVYDDGVELPDDQAYQLTHRHFRDLTYNFMAGSTTKTAVDVITAFDEQLARYNEFLAPAVYQAKIEHDAVVTDIIRLLERLGRGDLIDRWELAVKALDDARQNFRDES